jgi:hypothetical protein
LVPSFFPVDPGVGIVICEVESEEETGAAAVRETLDSVLQDQNLRGEKLMVRVFVGPRMQRTLREDIRRAYADRFLDVRIDEWQGSGTISRELRARLPSEEVALEMVEKCHGLPARKMVERLAEFFHLKNPGNRKEDILRTVQSHSDEGRNFDASESE